MMFEIAFSIILAGVAVCAIQIGARYLDMRARAEFEYEIASADFFDAASTLIGVKDIPDDVVALISHLNSSLSDKSSVKSLLFAGVSPQLNDSQAREFTSSVDGFFERNKELRPIFAKLMAAWFVAITSQSLFLGYLLRLVFTTKRVTKVTEHQTVHRFAVNDLADSIASNGVRIG